METDQDEEKDAVASIKESTSNRSPNESFLQDVMDASAETKSPGHRRKISWASDILAEMPTPERSERQRSDTSSLKTPDLHSPDDTHSKLFQSSFGSKSGTFELPDGQGIVNPLEAEAEGYLVRAMERLENQNPQRKPEILSNVPDEAIPKGFLENILDLDESGDPKTPANPDISSLSPKPARGHKRNPTLDERLFGLAYAIDTIHTEGIDAANAVDSGIPTNVDIDQSVPQSSFDTFAQNAGTWYDQVQGDTVNGVPSVTRQGSLVRRRPRVGSVSSVLSAGTPNPIPEVLSEDPVTLSDHRLSDIESQDTPDEKTPSEDKLEKEDKLENEKSNWVRSIIFDEWAITQDIRNFVRPKQNVIRLVLQIVVLSISVPSLAAAAILFYLVDNPPTGRLQNDGNPIDGKILTVDGDEFVTQEASWSYFILFFGVRQMVTLLLALGTQLFLIDFLAIDRSYLFRFGSRLPLFIMQARGWPFVLFFWSLYDWGLLSGSQPFFAHWLHFQSFITLFNGSNPSGDIVVSAWNHRILGIACGLSFVVAVKRFWMAVFLGKQTYYRYSEKLATVMQKILLISEVAALSKQLGSSQGKANLKARGTTLMETLTEEKMANLLEDVPSDHESSEDRSTNLLDDSITGAGAGAVDTAESQVVDPKDRNPLTGKLSNLQRNRIVRLLGAWEEPTEYKESSIEELSIASLMHFRRALSCLSNDLPFSATFGVANTRENCIQSCQEVYGRLMNLSTRSDVLNFEVLALLGAKPDGSLDQAKLLEMIRLFRPDRNGSLSMLHFVRSVDKVYKEMRMLKASVRNSSKIDGQFETIFNVGFYGIILIIVLNVLGFDPLALFVSISGLVLGFAFMIGTASSKYFEGLLFILVRRPYSIGDCIHVSDPNQDTSYTASAFWCVEDITLFSTHVRFFFTNERASLSNGSLANSRIINSSKSYNAAVYHLLKFPIDVAYEKVKLFHEALENFVRNRPREWIGLSSFRATTVNANLGYIEYLVAVDHRESWAYWSQVKTSQSDLMRFGVELAAKLDIVYHQPTLPIELSVLNRESSDMHPRKATDDSQALPTDAGSTSLRANPRAPIDMMELHELAAKFPPRKTRSVVANPT